MARTTRDDIWGWIKERPETSTHMAVMRDWFDGECYPIYVDREENVEIRVRQLKEPAGHEAHDRLMEIYSFTGRHSIEDQLDADRVYNLD